MLPIFDLKNADVIYIYMALLYVEMVVWQNCNISNVLENNICIRNMRARSNKINYTHSIYTTECIYIKNYICAWRKKT